MKNWQPQPHSQLPEQAPPTATVTPPYVRHLSETIQRILAPLGIRTSFRPHRTLWQTLVRLKDHIPLQQRAGVVYWIPCGSCSKVYISQTGRTMEHHLKEHKWALTSGNTAQSGVAEHEQMHEISWKEAKVVDSHPYYRQRCVLEAWHICIEHQTMNRDECPLPSEYNPWFWNQLLSDYITIITACLWHFVQLLILLYIATILILLLLLLFFLSLSLSFLTSPHHLSPIPAIFVYKNACRFFVTLSFLFDEDPGLDRNIWIKWSRHRPVKIYTLLYISAFIELFSL